ncbi:MAG TPA: aminotransferase class III-fold pyridoxal phosphate-dependent enzyme, partial [Candidatus Sabulitectum sp.]|nr:aminotransferase class III-fold pyridoxal phosphate-dependent enzyme [Candidatus Sabulitectum sp.]
MSNGLCEPGHLWHPYSDIDKMEGRSFPAMASAGGVRLIDDSGKEYLDGISSWWCVNLGHGHPRIVNAIVQQARTLQHSIIGGMSHAMADKAAERLAGVTPEGLERVYLASDGASAVEAAVRMALQYWWNTGRPEKKTIISIEGGYHGDTLGAVG